MKFQQWELPELRGDGFDLHRVLISTVLETPFSVFHKENPHVYRALKRMALKLKRRGHKRCGMKMLFEVLRWRTMMKTTDKNFKLNNNYTAPYSRLLMKLGPDLVGFFEVRG